MGQRLAVVAAPQGEARQDGLSNAAKQSSLETFEISRETILGRGNAQAFASLCISSKAIRTASSEIRREVFHALKSCQTTEQRSDTERGQARSLRSETQQVHKEKRQ